MLHVVRASLDIHEQHDMVLHNTNKDCLYVGIASISCSIRGLNLILSIYMGSSFGKVSKRRANIASEKFFSIVDDAKLLCVVDVSSWCFVCRHSKSLLSH